MGLPTSGPEESGPVLQRGCDACSERQEPSELRVTAGGDTAAVCRVGGPEYASRSIGSDAPPFGMPEVPETSGTAHAVAPAGGEQHAAAAHGTDGEVPHVGRFRPGCLHGGRRLLAGASARRTAARCAVRSRPPRNP
jgi:hypothetical protein